MEPVSFTPSPSQNLRENAVVCVGIAVVAPLIMLLRRSMSQTGLIITGLGGGAVMFLFYTLRFLILAPKRVEISDQGVCVVRRSGEKKEIAWDEITAASLTSSAGLTWKLTKTDGALTFRDDGYSVRQWSEISLAIKGQLDARNVAIKCDLCGEPFLS
jgi:hypothetical protein